MDAKTILVVDDDATTRLMSRVTLEKAGFSVVEAKSGEVAIEQLPVIRPDAVLLDVGLPGMDGFTTCETIRKMENYEHLPIMMLTGLNDVISIDKAYRIGATDFVTKPINWSILGHRLNYIIRANNALSEVQQLAYFDNLTGLANRTLLSEHLTVAIKRAKRYREKLAILFIDLDNFKRINDSLGHNAGDVLLKEISDRLQLSLRESDLVGRSLALSSKPIARFGGDEFIVLLTNGVSIKVATSIAQRIIKALHKPVKIGEHEVPISASLGIAMYPEDGDNSQDLLKNADTAMYHAKEAGKNDFCFYDRSMNELALHKLEMERALQTALINHQFKVYFQPKIDVKTNLVAGAEALVRWDHPRLGSISPREFIPMAEESNLIIELGSWILRQACLEAKKWHEMGYDHLHVAVNLSPRQFQDSRLSKIVHDILADTGLPAECLKLELTEGMIMQNTEHTLNVLAQLKSLNVHLSLDDFGTGYSSLRYLSQFPLDELKIDRSFINNLGSSENDKTITDAVITLAHGLHLTVVAEGVETLLQADYLKSKSCELLQGNLVSYPLSTEDFTHFLHQHADNHTHKASITIESQLNN